MRFDPFSDSTASCGSGRDRHIRESLSEMVYADGSPMRRGHLVYIPGEGASRVYTVAGWDLSPVRDARVMLVSPLGSVRYEPPTALSRWMPGAGEAAR